MNEIAIYTTKDGKTRLEVNLKDETVWLTQEKMAVLFGRERSVVTKHLHNIFKSNELSEKSNVQFLHIAGSDKPVKYYNLDVIISVGYRVNSKRGTQFRIWATNVLRDHIVRGYTINEKRLKQQIEHYNDLKNTINIIGSVLERHSLEAPRASGLLKVVADFAYALDVLDAYDHQELEVADTSHRKTEQITYEQAREAINTLRAQYKASEIFGTEKDQSLKGSLANIFQTFGGKELYPSLEEKAANLLYFLVKNHSFVDGNKRIAAFLFLWFLERNKALYRKDGSKRIADNALVAITLMIAESNPKHKDTIVKVVVNLINRKN